MLLVIADLLFQLFKLAHCFVGFWVLFLFSFYYSLEI